MYEKVAGELFQKAEADFHNDIKRKLPHDVLYGKNLADPADPEDQERWERDKMNITQHILLETLTKYDIAPGACSYVRGQEHIFGSCTSKYEKNEVIAVCDFP